MGVCTKSQIHSMPKTQDSFPSASPSPQTRGEEWEVPRRSGEFSYNFPHSRQNYAHTDSKRGAAVPSQHFTAFWQVKEQ